MLGLLYNNIYYLRVDHIFFFHAQVIKPLGAGQEVGRSCHLLEFKDKRILLDCGIHPGLSGKILNKRLV